MPKRITVAQLSSALKKAPSEVKTEARNFLQRGLAEYKRVVIQNAPWKVGQGGGGVPRDTGNLREKHRTEIKGFVGKYGVRPQDVKYAGYVHEGTYRMNARPWLDYARRRASMSIEKHYKIFMDNILKFIAQ